VLAGIVLTFRPWLIRCSTHNICPLTGGIIFKKREFYVVIERDEDGVFIGEVPQLRGCYTQGKTLDELMKNIQEVIHLCLKEQPETAELP